MAQTVYLQTQILEKDIKDYECKLYHIRDRIYQFIKTDDDQNKIETINNQSTKIEMKDKLKVCIKENLCFLLIIFLIFPFISVHFIIGIL